MYNFTQIRSEPAQAPTIRFAAHGQNSPAGQDEFRKYLPSSATAADGLIGSAAWPTEIGPGGAGSSAGSRMLPPDIGPGSGGGSDGLGSRVLPPDIGPGSGGPSDGLGSRVLPPDIGPGSGGGSDGLGSRVLPPDIGPGNTGGSDGLGRRVLPPDIGPSSADGSRDSSLMPIDVSPGSESSSASMGLMPTDLGPESRSGAANSGSTSLMPISMWAEGDPPIVPEVAFGESTPLTIFGELVAPQPLSSVQSEELLSVVPAQSANTLQIMQQARRYALNSVMSTLTQTLSRVL